MPKRTTTLGSPCSPAWDDAWVDRVDQTEQRVGRCICGAKTPSVQSLDARAGHIAPDDVDQPWTPCMFKPNHPNGRCRFHGGVDLTGGQPGNRNAAVHGLYARQLRPCSQSCPMWDKCPLAGADVAQLAPAQRPTCPYEQADYNTALTDTVAYIDTIASSPENELWTVRASRDLPTHENPHLAQLARRTAMLHVMVNRAAVALREHDLVETSETKSGDYHAKFSRPHAYLQAFLRLSSEYRRYLDLLEKTAHPGPQQCGDSEADFDAYRRRHRAQLDERQRRSANDTLLTPEAQEELEVPDGDLSADHAARMIEFAFDYLDNGNSHAAIVMFNNALQLNPEKAAPHYDAIEERTHDYRKNRNVVQLIPNPTKDPP